MLAQTEQRQQQTVARNTNLNLPDAPDYRSAEALTGQANQSQGAASISGIVLDANGQPLEGARISLGRTGDEERSTFSDANGRFSFGSLPAGTFRLTVTSSGMQTFVSADIALQEAEKRRLPQIALGIAGTTQEVRVTVTQVEIAQEEVKEAEKQRAFGVLPNFYSSYVWNAAPLDPRQKFDLAFHSILDPVSLVANGAVAGAEQATDTFPGYGQGAQGYAKRYGATFADDAIARLLGSAVLPSLLHQDPRYFYKGTGSVRSRIRYAVTRAVVTRGDDGRDRPNYSSIGGSFAAGAISNAYHPSGDRGVGLTLGNGLIDTAGHAADNLIREFVLRRVTPNVPAYKNGQPPKK